MSISKSKSIAFAEAFTKHGGFFVYNASKKEASGSLRDMLQVKKAVDCICMDYERSKCSSVDSRWPIRRSYPERASCVLTACSSLIVEGGMVLSTKLRATNGLAHYARNVNCHGLL